MGINFMILQVKPKMPFKSAILLSALCASVVPSTQARADFVLGEAAFYGIIAGPDTKSMQFSNSTYNGNVATDNPNTAAGGSYVQFSSGTINGNFSFVGPAQTNLGSGTLNGSKIANDANVSSAYNTISSLSATFAGETTGTSFGGSGSLTATNGTLINGNYVFTTTASNFLQGGALTITGSATDYVVINVTGDNNVQLKNLLTLSGGITDDHVFINITGTGQQVGGNTNGGIVNGIFVALNDKFNIDNTTIDGRVIGGGSNQDFQLVSGFELYAPPSPPPQVNGVPEPSTWAMMLLGFVGIGFMAYRRKPNTLVVTA
jgi:hypothetical protein